METQLFNLLAQWVQMTNFLGTTGTLRTEIFYLTDPEILFSGRSKIICLREKRRESSVSP